MAHAFPHSSRPCSIEYLLTLLPEAERPYDWFVVQRYGDARWICCGRSGFIPGVETEDPLISFDKQIDAWAAAKLLDLHFTAIRKLLA